MKSIFLLSHTPDPRMYKRIHLLGKLGNVSIICIRRTNQDTFVIDKESDISHYVFDMDLPLSSQPLKRYNAIKAFKKFAMTKLEEISPDIIYTEGIDMLSITNTYSKRNPVIVIYEVADLRENFIKHPGKKITKKIIDFAICQFERKVFNCVSLLVVTSIKFYTEHYAKFFPQERVLEMPNMPEQNIFSSYKRKTRSDEFVVAFIGGIRYINQMKLLIDATKNINVKVFFAGAGDGNKNQLELEQYCKDKNWVKISGKFDYKKDIVHLYEAADCIYSVYDADNPNVRIALPNKLYEAIICELPIIVAQNTYLSELVEKAGVGISVSHNNPSELTNAILRLKNDHTLYERIVANCIKLKPELDLEKYNSKLLNKIDIHK